MRRASLVLPLLLLPALPAQEAPWAGTWRVIGRDDQGWYSGTAEVRSATAAGELELNARVQRARRDGRSLVPEGATLELAFRARPHGAALVGARPGTAGAAGALAGQPGAGTAGAFQKRDGALIGRVGDAREVLWREPAGVEPSIAHALAVLDADRAGDWGRPYQVEALPFLHRDTTVGRASAAASYAVRPDLSEAGPEVVYRLSLPARARVTAWVEGDAGAVDVDVHVLGSLRLTSDGLAATCVARGNAVAEAELPAGPAYVVVDTWQSAAHAGPYRLRIDAAPVGEWYERPVARGVTLRTRSYPELFGARQTASVVVVDPAVPGVRVGALGGGGCQPPAVRARAAGAVAALNAGFFAQPGCASVSLLKTEGTLRAPNRVTRSAFGVDGQGRFHIDRIAAGADWPAVREAVGGVPRVVRAGEAVDESAQEGNGGAFATARHPRSAVGIAGDGRLLLAAIDGRTTAGAGMSLAELGRWLVWLGARDALNLDGGGSTCLWVADEPFGGVVNHPSDNGKPDHEGVRRVDSVVAVWADPLDRDPVWLALPPAEAPLAIGAAFTADVAAADPEGQPVTLALEAPAAQGDRVRLEPAGTGAARLRFTPAAADAGPVRLRLRAEVGGRAFARELTLRVGP